VRLTRALLLVTLASLAGARREAAADEHDRCGMAWTPMRGTVSPGTRCGVMILTADAAAARGGSGSTGRAQWDGTTAGARSFALTVQRLTGERGTVQIELPGAYLLLADGQVGLYTSEPAWSVQGWRPWPGAPARRLTEPVRVEAVIDGAWLTARLDGGVAGRWRIGLVPGGAFAVWVTGPRGARPRVRVSDWQVR
jgi:hypothetical protein